MREHLAGSTILALAFLCSCPDAARSAAIAHNDAADEQARFELVRAAATLPAVQQAEGRESGNPQKRTVSDMRNVGTAMFSWLTDQASASAAAASTTDTKGVDLADYPPISRADLEKLLVPQYIQAIPETDGWGNPYEYYLNTADVLAPHVMAIRSPGRDGRSSGESYRVSGFEPENYDEDIVWVDGFFARWPQAPTKSSTR